jgi:hypothetical protein
LQAGAFLGDIPSEKPGYATSKKNGKLSRDNLSHDKFKNGNLSHGKLPHGELSHDKLPWNHLNLRPSALTTDVVNQTSEPHPTYIGTLP